MTMREAFVKNAMTPCSAWTGRRSKRTAPSMAIPKPPSCRISYSGQVYIKPSARSATHPKIKCGKLEHGLRLMVSQTP